MSLIQIHFLLQSSYFLRSVGKEYVCSSLLNHINAKQCNFIAVATIMKMFVMASLCNPE